MTIGIGYFIKTEKERLDVLLTFWRGQYEIDPVDFPTWMLEGEWEEQYRCWQEVT